MLDELTCFKILPIAFMIMRSSVLFRSGRMQQKHCVLPSVPTLVLENARGRLNPGCSSTHVLHIRRRYPSYTKGRIDLGLPSKAPCVHKAGRNSSGAPLLLLFVFSFVTSYKVIGHEVCQEENSTYVCGITKLILFINNQ